MRADLREFIERLDFEYDPGQGSIGQVRDGRFDEIAFERLLAVLRECPAAEGEIPVRFARLLWFMPWVIEWQAQRLAGQNGHAALMNAYNAVFTEVERILGVP